MQTSAQKNSLWIVKVREFLSAGFGVEDIALKLGCDADDVRLEVKILREEGLLRRLFEKKK